MSPRLLGAFGGLLLLAGILINEWSVAWLLSPDEKLSSPQLLTLVRGLQCVLSFLGLAIVFGRRHIARSRLATTAVKILFFVPLSVLLTLHGLFLFFEFVPTAATRIGLSGIPYYDLVGRFVPDDTLVFRKRPESRIDIRGAFGDLWNENFGVAPDRFDFSTHYDEEGFRRQERRERFDTVLLGDSFLEIGRDYDDALSGRVANASGKTVRDLGIAWYGPYQYVEVLERYGAPAIPRWAVLAFYEGNDLRDVGEYLQWRNGGPYYHYWDYQNASIASRYSRAIRDMAGQLADAYRNWSVTQGSPSDNVHPDLVQVDLGDKTVWMAFDYREAPLSVEEVDASPEVQALGDVLADFKRACGEIGCRPLVLFIPTKSHIYAELSTAQSGEAWLAVRDRFVEDADAFEAALEQMCRGLSLDWLSLTAAFRRDAREGGVLFQRFDTHWNARAREVAAALLAKRLAVSE